MLAFFKFVWALAVQLCHFSIDFEVPGLTLGSFFEALGVPMLPFWARWGYKGALLCLGPRPGCQILILTLPMRPPFEAILTNQVEK